MADQKNASRCWSTPMSLTLGCFLAHCIFLVLFTSEHIVAGETAMPIQKLDLSYLHRCGETDMANAIRGKLEGEQSKGSEETIVDIDLTASLINKNLSEILSSLQHDDDDKDEAPPSVAIQLTARRNQLSAGKATEVLEFVLQNGPTNETTTEETVANDTMASGDEEKLSTEETNEKPSEETKEMLSEEADSESLEPAVDEEATATNTDVEAPDTDSAVEEATTNVRIRPAFVSVQSLDLGWNNLGSSSSKSGLRSLNGALRKLLANPERCPPLVRLDVCGLGPQACRDVAKGIVERYRNGKNAEIPPLSLNLACNEGIGDVGVAALAAAIRTVGPAKEPKKKRRKKRKASKQQQKSSQEDGEGETKNEDEASGTTNDDSPPEESKGPITILERLDLSGCGIGDAGAEALAIALANNPLCVKHLDLSNNQITDQGASALAQVLGTEKEGVAGFVETLDLSHNTKLGNDGAKSLAQAFQRDGMSRLILRSCNVRADGAACFGAALKVIGSRANSSAPSRLIDLSGNPLGILSKAKKSGSKYSATALKSKATDTTKAYMNIIGKSLQKGLNSINGGVDTLESDDEEEAGMEAEEEDESRKKCGALSLAEAFIRDGNEEKHTTPTGQEQTSICVKLGLRHCSFDTRAAEALAAVLYEAKEEYPNMKLSMDMTMNHVLEDGIIAALHGEDDDQLADMAEVYLDALEVMREARQRALEASRMAAARAKAQAERESTWAAPPPSSRYMDDWDEEEEDDRWDEDDYDRNVEEDYSEEDW